MLESGFGPYALSRLAAATGGIYFVTRFDTRRMGFDPARMLEYAPEWALPRDKYDDKANHSDLRRAVLNAAQITQQRKLSGMPSLSFPAADGGPEFKDAMARNQVLAALTVAIIDDALRQIGKVSKDTRDREDSRRWQAHYDLIRGRLLAVKVRCFEYNWHCGQMKSIPRNFTDAKFNAWRLDPNDDIRSEEKAVVAGREAQALPCDRVIDDHPATPWAALAERELKTPLSFKWTETRVAPAPRVTDAELKARTNREMQQPKPPVTPKL